MRNWCGRVVADGDTHLAAGGAGESAAGSAPDDTEELVASGAVDSATEPAADGT